MMRSITTKNNIDALPADAKSFFVDNGYTGAFSLPDDIAINQLKQALQKQQWPKFFNNLLNKEIFYNPFPAKTAYLSSKLVFDLASEPAILDGVANLLGSDILLWVGEAITRMPFNTGQKWHIDATNAFVGGVHVSIAITDMNMKNGCLQVIPKTHTYGVNLHELSKQEACDLSDENSVLRLADRLHPENAPHTVVPVEVKAGEFFFTKGGLWHGVGPNRTFKKRMAVVARYATPDIKVTYPKGRPVTCILVRGEDRYGLNELRKPPSL